MSASAGKRCVAPGHAFPCPGLAASPARPAFRTRRRADRLCARRFVDQPWSCARAVSAPPRGGLYEPGPVPRRQALPCHLTIAHCWKTRLTLGRPRIDHRWPSPEVPHSAAAWQQRAARQSSRNSRTTPSPSGPQRAREVSSCKSADTPRGSISPVVAVARGAAVAVAGRPQQPASRKPGNVHSPLLWRADEAARRVIKPGQAIA